MRTSPQSSAAHALGTCARACVAGCVVALTAAPSLWAQTATPLPPASAASSAGAPAPAPSAGAPTPAAVTAAPSAVAPSPAAVTAAPTSAAAPPSAVAPTPAAGAPAPPGVAPGPAYVTIPPGYVLVPADEYEEPRRRRRRRARRPPPLPEPVYMGPPEVYRYTPGETLPPGYHIESRASRGAIGGGVALVGVPWLASVVVAASNDFERGTSSLLIPVFGPWVTLATYRASCGQIGDPEPARCLDRQTIAGLLVTDGVVQVLGAVLATWGAVSVRDYAVRDRNPIRVAPVRYENGGYGLTIGGRL